MDDYDQSVVLALQVDEAQKQGEVHNLVQGNGVPEDMGATCGINCSDATMSSLTSESVEKTLPLSHNNTKLARLETNGHEVEVANILSASENLVTCNTIRQTESNCRKVCESHSSLDEHDRVRCTADHLDEHVSCVETNFQKLRKVSESPADSIKVESSASFPVVHDTVGSACAKDSVEEVLHDGLERSDPKTEKVGSCTLIQIDEAVLLKEDASGASSIDETGDVCKMSFPADNIKGETSTPLPVVHDTVGSACAKHSVEEVLHGGLERLNPETEKVGSCTLFQIDEAVLLKEDASGASSKEETGDVCKMSSTADKIKGETNTSLPVVHHSGSCAKHSVGEVVDGGLKRILPETENFGSCTLAQVDEASLLREDASGASFEDETGDLCKISSPVEHVDKQSERTMGETVRSAAEDCASKDEISPNNEVDLLPPERPLPICLTKKLLVLDVNGLLADIVYVETPCKPEPARVISNKAVFTRPFYKEFLDFCFMHFNVGIWTSRTKRNVESILDFLLGESKNKLLFCWDQSHCTDSGFGTVEDRRKPLIIKKLKKLWEKDDPHLPWERGVFNESNTLLLDDTPHKALCNPPHTAIFPESFRYTDVNDTSLSPEGELRAYLKGVAEAENVQTYVKENPYGQRPITERNVSWRYYQKVIAACSSSSEAATDRYASYHWKGASSEAAPYRHASYHRNANHPPFSSDVHPRRYRNHDWKANHFPSPLEAAPSRDSSYPWRANNPHLEPSSYRHGNFRSEAYNSTSSSEGITHRHGSYHWKDNHPYSSVQARHDRGGRYHCSATHSFASSEATRDRRGGYYYRADHGSSSSGANHDRRGSYHCSATNNLASSEATHDRRGGYNYRADRGSSFSEANHDRRGNYHRTPTHSLSSSASGFNGRGSYHRKPNYSSSSSQDFPNQQGSFHWRIYNMQPSSEATTNRPGSHHQEAVKDAFVGKVYQRRRSKKNEENERN